LGLDSFQIKKRRVSVFDNKINAVCYGRSWRLKLLPRCASRRGGERRVVRETPQACLRADQIDRRFPGKLLVDRRTKEQRESLLKLRSFKF
jgi:hypothetical protein